MEGFTFGKTVTGTAKSKVPIKDKKTIDPTKTCRRTAKVVKDSIKSDDKVIITNEARKVADERKKKKLSTLKELSIEGTEISLFGYQDLKDVAVCKVDKNTISGLGSVNDSQMGPGFEESNEICQTCHLTFLDCPGHYGYIELNALIYHPFFFKEIISVLNCVCGSCSRLLLTKEDIIKKGISGLKFKNRLARLEEESRKVESCPLPPEDLEGGEVKKCKHKHEYLSQKFKETLAVQYKIKGDEEVKILDIKTVKEIFEAISDKDAELLGFSPKTGSRPVNMILQALPVIPPNVRFPEFRNGVILQSELTKQYVKIVTINNSILADPATPARRLKKTQEDPETQRKNKITALFNAVKHLFENSGGDYTGAIFKSLTELIQSKRGIIRGNLMGKTTNFSGRTVLGPDPFLKFGQIGVPIVFASKLTQKETVCSYNIDMLTDMLQEKEEIYQASDKSKTYIKKVGRKITHIIFGPKRKYPGAVFALKPGVKYKLRIGDKVWRHLRNGDMIMFGRQPTLHKHSLMAYEVVLRDQLTIGLHPSYTTPHNAD